MQYVIEEQSGITNRSYHFCYKIIDADVIESLGYKFKSIMRFRDSYMDLITTYSNTEYDDKHWYQKREYTYPKSSEEWCIKTISVEKDHLKVFCNIRGSKDQIQQHIIGQFGDDKEKRFTMPVFASFETEAKIFQHKTLDDVTLHICKSTFARGEWYMHGSIKTSDKDVSIVHDTFTALNLTGGRSAIMEMMKNHLPWRYKESQNLCEADLSEYYVLESVAPKHMYADTFVWNDMVENQVQSEPHSKNRIFEVLSPSNSVTNTHFI
jgi:hypothetical protein